MDRLLAEETARLERSWARHDPGTLRDYLVAGVEDPRLNVQSILARHFVLHALTGERFRPLRESELAFAVAMNWLLELVAQRTDNASFGAIRHALDHGSDNAEGLEIPGCISKIYRHLPRTIGDTTLPNYLAEALDAFAADDVSDLSLSPRLNLFMELWRSVLENESNDRRLPVLELACGSANDYRFLEASGMARLIDYTGLDLCAHNIANARALFPGARFEIANVFDLPFGERSFDLCFVQDLFEHFSLAGLERALDEICRVTRHAICAGFFQMDERPDHLVRPVREYHWNLLSLQRIQAGFARRGFTAQVVHVGTFLRVAMDCDRTHNPNAYTLLLQRN